jgi:membrane-associated PAP2 superfamily phosphatase
MAVIIFSSSFLFYSIFTSFLIKKIFSTLSTKEAYLLSNYYYPITIQIQLADKANSTGNLILNNPSKAIEITATKEKPQEHRAKPNIH